MQQDKTICIIRRQNENEIFKKRRLKQSDDILGRMKALHILKLSGLIKMRSNLLGGEALVY